MFPRVDQGERRRHALTRRVLDVLGRGALARAIMGHATIDGAGVGPALVVLDRRDVAGTHALELLDDAAVFLVDVDGARVAIAVLDVRDAAELVRRVAPDGNHASRMVALPLPEIRVITIAGAGVRVGEVVLGSEIPPGHFTRGAA